MAFINIFVSNPCRIGVQSDQLQLKGEEYKEFPIEDINSILIENHQVRISTYALNRLVELGAVIMVCDKYHMPSGILIPYNRSTRRVKLLNAQYSMPRPLAKKLWQLIIKAKINNQAEGLRLCNREGADELYKLSQKVLSGDSSNIEAIAAQKYFKYLYGDDFVRHKDDIINISLDYGYSILRSMIARTLAVYGFETNLGLKHCSELNNYNLADDIIEPLRPVVDLYVYKNIDFSEHILNTTIKKGLYNIVNLDIKINSQYHSVNYCIELMIQSLKQAVLNKVPKISLPIIIEGATHRYE